MLAVSSVEAAGEWCTLGWSEGEHTQWATGAARDFERRGNHHRSGGRQLIQVYQAGNAEFAGAMHRGVVGKWWVEGSRLPRVRPNGLDADTQHVTLMGEKLGAFPGETRRMRAVLAGI